MKLLRVMLLYLTISFVIGLAFAANARITDSSGANTISLFFTGDATTPNRWYMDAFGANPDASILICGLGQKYVGAAYAINVAGSWKYALITYKDNANALSYTDKQYNSTCYYTSAGFLTFSPSRLVTPDPDVFFAAFPGRPWAAIATTPNPGIISSFEAMLGELRGDYIVTRSFDEVTNTININEPDIIFQTSYGTVTKKALDSQFGVNDDRRMVVGVCADDYGSSCYDGRILPIEGTFPLSLASGAGIIDDQNVYNRYVVINGKGYSICIGANLRVTIDSIDPSPVYYSQQQSINFTITNFRDTPTEERGGNVRVTTDFNIRIQIYENGNPSNKPVDYSSLITNDLLPGDSVQITFNWNATAKSGIYVVNISVDSTDVINECDETDNYATTTFELKPVVIPRLKINGVETTTFDYAGVPYNLSIHLEDSDGLNISNGTVVIVEENGINIFLPLQIWEANVSQSQTNRVGTKIINMVEIPLDYYGNAEVTFTPTGNPLYAPQYSYLNIQPVIGNYSIYLTGRRSNGEEFVFVVNNNITNKYPLQVANFYTYDNLAMINLPNKNNYVEIIANHIYTIFSNFWKVMTK